TKLNFLDGDDDLFLFGLVGLLLLLVLKFSEVNNLANGRIGIGCHLNQIHATLTRCANCLARVHDPKLFSIVANYAHLGHANAFVNSSHRRSPKIRTTATAKTCSYCRTSLEVAQTLVCVCLNELQTKVCANQLFVSARVA